MPFISAFFGYLATHFFNNCVYPFEQAREAYEDLARGAFGKVVIKVG